MPHFRFNGFLKIPGKHPAGHFQSRSRAGRYFILCLLYPAIAVIVFSSCWGGSVNSEIHYVSCTADPGGDGTSWKTAFPHPQDALDAARPGDQIWVGEGVYGLREPEDRLVVELKTGVMVLGGFTGTETDPGERNPEEAVAVLDGQGQAYHVVRAMGADGTVIDGFTITNGDASGNALESSNGGEFTGGGMFSVSSSPEIRQCRFVNNKASFKGGAIFNEKSSPLVVDCIFEGNSAFFGGAVYNEASFPTTINSIFRANASWISGGAVSSFASSPTYVNSLFSGNETTYTGGAILANTSSTAVINCTFTGNRSRQQPGGGLSLYRGRAKLSNCILWGDVSPGPPEVWSDEGEFDIVFSIIQGGYAGSENLNLPPNFVQDGYWDEEDRWAEGDYQLAEGSAAIDTGTAQGAPNFDLAGKARPQLLAHDRGAYEHTPDSDQ